MRITHAEKIIRSTIAKNPNQSLFLMGPPGVAKTSICFTLAASLNIPKERVLLFRPSLRDPVDLMGTPRNDGNVTRWTPPEEFWNFRVGTGPGLIIWDELPQGITAMQNAAAGALLDKQIGPLTLDPQVIQIATGNRTSDKAGANRLVSQLSNRVKFVDVDAHLDDWCSWAYGANVDPMVIAFLRLRPNFLHDFEPDRRSNPTPRTWEMVSRSCDHDLSRDLYFADVSGLIGEAAAAEYVGFRDMASKMPNIDWIMTQPDKAEVPSEPGVMYAVCAALASRATDQNFDRVMTYLHRLPVEFSTMAVKDSIIRSPKIKSSRAFTEWAVKNASVFC
jgi:hypothetical protein